MKKTATKKPQVVFSADQFEWMLGLVSGLPTTIESTQAQFVAEVVRRDIRAKILKQAERQGYALPSSN